MSDIFSIIAIITGVEIRVERQARYQGATETVFTEARPATLADADHALVAYGFGRTQDWDLGPNGDVRAQACTIDNQFNGTRAARLEAAIGTSHDDLETVVLGLRDGVPTVNDGDLISDQDECALYVVAGSRFEDGTARIHMVGEGQTWDQRYTTDFPFGSVVKVARRKV